MNGTEVHLLTISGVVSLQIIQLVKVITMRYDLLAMRLLLELASYTVCSIAAIEIDIE